VCGFSINISGFGARESNYIYGQKRTSKKPDGNAEPVVLKRIYEQPRHQIKI
jgi:hypothetical protein